MALPRNWFLRTIQENSVKYKMYIFQNDGRPGDCSFLFYYKNSEKLVPCSSF